MARAFDQTLRSLGKRDLYHLLYVQSPEVPGKPCSYIGGWWWRCHKWQCHALTIAPLSTTFKPWVKIELDTLSLQSRVPVAYAQDSGWSWALVSDGVFDGL